MVSAGFDEGKTTKQRLVREAMHLFAERGFRGATVADVEMAAGLVPRSGALYKHFASKRSLLEAGLDRHVQQLDSMQSVIDVLPLGDLRAELTLVARWLLAELNRQREAIIVIEREGDSFPELRERFFAGVFERGYRQAEEIARRWLKDLPVDIDFEALATLVVGTLVAHRWMEWTFGRNPLEVDDERLVRAFVELFATSTGLLEGSGS